MAVAAASGILFEMNDGGSTKGRISAPVESLGAANVTSGPEPWLLMATRIDAEETETFCSDAFKSEEPPGGSGVWGAGCGSNAFRPGNKVSGMDIICGDCLGISFALGRGCGEQTG